MGQRSFVISALIVSTSAVSMIILAQQNREQINHHSNICRYTLDVTATAENAALRNTRKTLVGLYKSVDVAFANKNIDQLFSYFAPNFIHLDLADTVLNRQQLRQRTIEYWHLTDIPKVRHEVKQIQDSNGTMIVVSVTHFGSKDTKSVDVWELTNQGWKLTSSCKVSSSNIGIYHYP